MTLKEALEEFWNRPMFNPLHINIWSWTKRGIQVSNDPDIWVSRGRRVRCD